MKYYIFGDSGGHKVPLQRSLTDLGADLDTFTLPDDITIIHLGDLIHKGPHSSLLLQMVDGFIQNNPGQWVQLLGNHEFQHLNGPSFWRCNCTEEDKRILQKWWETGEAKVSFGLDNITPPNLEISARPKLVTPSETWLFTHAGLSFDWWEIAGFESSAVDISQKLNSLSVKQVTTPGELLYGPSSKYAYDPPGPVWAIGNTEVFLSWQKSREKPTFNQVYGHTTSYAWSRKTWWGGGLNLKDFKAASKLNPETRAVLTDLGDNILMVGIDPGYSNYADQKKQPYLTLETK